MQSQDAASSFWSRVDKTGDCWLWTGACQPNGHGKISTAKSPSGGKSHIAHQVAYELTYGLLPLGMYLHKACETLSCVKPDHMRLSQEKSGRGAYPHGHIVKMTYPNDMVETVKYLYYEEGATQTEIAEALGVTQRVIWRLMHNHGLEARVAAKRFQYGATNDSWRGDRATYAAFHYRVRAILGTPSYCAQCGRSDSDVRYEWANLTGKYFDINDYVRMCTKCHGAFDAARRQATGEPTSAYVRRYAHVRTVDAR
jgi:hypothetical protein